MAGYGRKFSKEKGPALDYDQFVTHQDIHQKLLLENLSLTSNIFQHPLRVSMAYGQY